MCTAAVSNQGVLEQTLRHLFVGNNILVNSRKETFLKHPTSNNPLEIDIWIPDLGLCFEFQDVYHYTTTWDSHLPLQEVQHRDNFKSKLVREHGDTLVVIPCWWDGKVTSLVDAIRFLRPDVEVPKFQATEPLFPIPLNPEPDYLKVGILPGVGEVMLASFPSLQQFPAITPENSWWLGEKYDGVRYCWNPRNEIVYNRIGIELSLPQAFIDKLASHDIFIEGELWFGRGSFPESQKLVHSSLSVDWSMLRMIAFDKPDLGTHNMEYEERYSIMYYSFLDDVPFTVIAFRLLCSYQVHLVKLLNFVIDLKGEGIILNQPRSNYENGRSTSLIKLKAHRGDKEALIVDVTDTDLILQVPEGESFRMSLKDVTLLPIPKRGDVVTFSYDNYTRRSVPVNPIIQRIRGDLVWEQVIAQSIQSHGSYDQTKSGILEATSYRAAQFDAKPPKFWTSDKRRNMRLFFEAFAKRREFDPLVAKHWYLVEREAILQTKGGRYVLGRYKGSMIGALLDLLPEIGLDAKKFATMPRRHWQSMENRKQFFDRFAEEQGFDPLDAENWYQVETTAAKSVPGGSSTMRYYSGNLTKALMHTYPDIGLDTQKLAKRQYEVQANRRRFFDEFAKEHNFNPLIATNWYNVLASDITSKKGGSAVLYYYQGSFAKALISLFPNINLDINKLAMPRNYWQDENNQRSFFVTFAKQRGLDPLVPENWYSIKSRSLVQQKGATLIMQEFRGSFIKALVHLFPEVRFNTSQFKSCT